ncbi:MAG: hypothetical protein ACE5I1_26445 [bacterium]
MKIFKDAFNREVRLTDERYDHFVADHPEMDGQLGKIQETLLNPEQVVRSKIDIQVELFYRDYLSTPVTRKYLCLVVKVLSDDAFIITAYFTDTIKKGEILWKGK